MKKYNIDKNQDMSIIYDKKDIEINIKDNVSLKLFELINSNNTSKTIINLGKESKLILNRFCNKYMLDNNIEINLNGEKAKAEIVISAISDENQKIKVNINHNNKYTVSNIINNGITIKNGKLEFDIETKIEKGNINSNANQDSKIITMSDISSGVINPKLIINEYDTNAKHSAYIGEFKKEDIFYLESRGIPKEESYKLMIKGFLISNFNIDIENKNTILNMINGVRI